MAITSRLRQCAAVWAVLLASGMSIRDVAPQPVRSLIELDSGYASSMATLSPDGETTAETVLKLELVGQVGGPTHAMSAYGDILYMGSGRTVVVVDSLDGTLSRAGAFPVPNQPNDIAAHDLHLYTAHASGVSIFDLADPHRPTEIGFIESEHPAQDVIISQGVAYVAECSDTMDRWGWWDSEITVSAYDVGDPSSPALLGTTRPIYGHYGDIDVADGHVYLVDSSLGEGLEVFDFTDPRSPRLCWSGMYNQVQYGEPSIDVRGEYAYMAMEREGLRVLDIGRPCTPRSQALTMNPSHENLVDVAVVGSRAFVAHRTGLMVFDVTDPPNPRFLELTELPGYDYDGISLAGDDLYVYADGRIDVVATDEGLGPTPIGSFLTAHEFGTPIHLQEGHLYAGDGVTDAPTVRIYGLQDPVLPTDAGSITIPTSADPIEAATHVHTFAAGVGRLFAGLGGPRRDTVAALDVSDPTRPDMIATVALEGHARLLGTVDGYLYGWSQDETGLTTIDVSDPEDIAVVGEQHVLRPAGELVLDGNRLYALNADAFQVYDFSDGPIPTLAGTYRLQQWAAGDLVIADDRAYFFAVRSSQAETELHVIDISDPRRPRPTSTEEMRPWRALAVIGEFILVTAPIEDGQAPYRHGIAIVSLVDPDHPVLLPDDYWLTLWTSMSNYTGFLTVAVNGELAYVGADRRGLYILSAREAEAAPTPTPELSPTPSGPKDRTPIALPYLLNRRLEVRAQG